MDLKSQINSLVKLQLIDKEIYALKYEKYAKPAQIKAIEAAFEEKKKELAVLEAQQLNLQKEKKDKELELGSKEESIKKLQTQLYQLKTNKEYQVMLQQIEDAKADVSLMEDRILESMTRIDQNKNDITREKERLKEQEQFFNAEKKKVQDRITEIDQRLAQMEASRKQAIPDIDAKIFSQYERILTNKDGLAIVTVANDSCSGCNMLVPPQVINLIKMYERIITCEVCNRMLYIAEDMGA